MNLIPFIFGIIWIIEQTLTILSLKYLFSTLKFNFPIFVTCVHMLFSFFLSMCTIIFLNIINQIFFAQTDNDNNNICQKKQHNDNNRWIRKTIKWKTIFTKIHIISILTIISIVCGNLSIGMIPIVFVQMMGAARTPLTGILSNLVRKTTFSQSTWILTFSMTFGIFIVTTKQFDTINAKNDIGIFMLGILISFISIFTGGLKTVFSKIILCNRDENPDSVSMLMYMSPFGFVYLFFLFILIEKDKINDVIFTNIDNKNRQNIIIMIIFTSLMSFVFNLFNFILLKMVNEITFQIMGLIRIVVVIVCSGYLFGENIGFIQITGIIFVLICSLWYFYIKFENITTNENQQKKCWIINELDDLKIKQIQDLHFK